MGVAEICRDIMPSGVPNYLQVIKYPTIKSLISEMSVTFMHKVVFLMVKDFCESLNVVRNMNETQMIDAATMLLDECGNFRLEDYTMMFQMGKKGELVKIRDRVDIEVLTEMLDTYWEKRNHAGEEQWQIENKHFETMGTQTRLIEHMHKEDGRLMTMAEGIQAAFGGLKQLVEEKVGNRAERQKLAEIEKNDVEAIKQRKKELGYD